MYKKLNELVLNKLFYYYIYFDIFDLIYKKIIKGFIITILLILFTIYFNVNDFIDIYFIYIYLYNTIEIHQFNFIKNTDYENDKGVLNIIFIELILLIFNMFIILLFKFNSLISIVIKPMILLLYLQYIIFFKDEIRNLME